MRPSSLLRKSLGLLGCTALLGAGLTVHAAGEPEITAVSSRVADNYVRTKQADGSFPRETYTFGEGGLWRSDMTDASIDKLKFIDIARIIAVPLAQQNYVPSRDPEQIKFLIMVYWGVTNGSKSASGSSVAYQNLQATQHPAAPPPPPPPANATASHKDGTAVVPDDSAANAQLAQVVMENRSRDKEDALNANLLGYDSEGVIGTDYGRNLALTGLHRSSQDLMEEVQENRYFVVIMAFDFQLLRKEKKHQLVWDTRFSIRQRGNDFDQQLAGMAQTASRYFGRDSHGLARKPLPDVHVDLGELKFLGTEPDKK